MISKDEALQLVERASKYQHARLTSVMMRLPKGWVKTKIADEIQRSIFARRKLKEIEGITSSNWLDHFVH